MVLLHYISLYVHVCVGIDKNNGMCALWESVKINVYGGISGNTGMCVIFSRGWS